MVLPGFEVATTAHVICHDQELYGPDVEEYRPERWLNAEAAREYEKYFGAWGFGTRVCIGKNIAQLEIYKATAQVRVLPANSPAVGVSQG